MPGVETPTSEGRPSGTWCERDQHAARIHLPISQQNKISTRRPVSEKQSKIALQQNSNAASMWKASTRTEQIMQAKHHGIQKMQFNVGIAHKPA